MSLHASRAAAEAAAARLRAYAQPQRLMILSQLLDGEQSVSQIEAATGIGQPALSQQLAALRGADIVRTRRASKLVYYRLADERVRACVEAIEAMFGGAAAGAAAVAAMPDGPGTPAGPPAPRRSASTPLPPSSPASPPPARPAPPPGAAAFARLL